MWATHSRLTAVQQPFNSRLGCLRTMPEKQGKGTHHCDMYSSRVVTISQSSRIADVKEQCSGDRPVCHRCSKRSLGCQYSADADASPMTALKRRYTALSEAYTQQGRRLAHLKTHREIDISKSPLEATRDPTSIDLLSNQLETRSVEPLSSDSATSTSASWSTSSSEKDTQDTAMRAMTILRALAFKPDMESIALLARIRSGENWCDIAQGLLGGQAASPDDNRWVGSMAAIRKASKEQLF